MAGYRASLGGAPYTKDDSTPVTHSASIRSELDHDDWRIIQKIIDAVPAGETGIGCLDDAYVQVMDETGAQDRHDVASIYHALLKIHEIRAPTLQARLERYRAGLEFDHSHSNGRNSSQRDVDRVAGLVNFTNTVGEIEDLLTGSETEGSDDGLTVRGDGSRIENASHNIKSRVPFLADADSDMGEDAGDETDAAYSKQYQRSGLPRYSTHGRDLKLEAGNAVDDLEVASRDHKYRAQMAGPPTRTEADTIAQFFDPPSFATGVDMSTPIRPASRTKNTQLGRDSDIPITYGGPVYGSTVESGSPRLRQYDDTAMFELQDESFNNTISSVPSPPPRIAALSSRAVAPERNHRPSVESISSAIGSLQTRTSTHVASTPEMDDLEREAEEMEKAFLMNAGGRGKQELRIMRKKAESFWEFGLTLRTFRHWLQSYANERVDQVQLIREIDHLKMARTFSRWRELKTRRERSARNASAIFAESAQRAYFANWRDALRRRRQEQQAQAIAERREKDELRTTWQNWKTKRLGRRTDRWKESMREKEVMVIEARQKRVVRSAFKNWRFATAQHRAVSFNAAFLVATTFHRWAHETHKAVRLRRVEEKYQAVHDRHDLKNALLTWKRGVRLRYATEDLQDIVADHLETAAWRSWRARLAERRKTNALDDNRVLRGALRTWKTRMGQLKSLAKRAYRVMADRDANVQRLAFNAWLASHNSKVVLEVRQERHLRSSLDTWKIRMDGNLEQYRKALAFDDKHIVNAARTALHKWRTRNQQRQLLEQQTTLFAERVLQERMLRTWRDRIGEAKTSLIQAAGTRKFFLIKRCWDKWRARHQQQQQELFLEQRKREECRTVFRSWCVKMKRTKSLRLRAEEYAKTYGQKHEKVAFDHWMHSLINLKARAHDVASKADKALMSDAFQIWTRATIKQGEALSLMHSFRYVRQQERLHKIFHHWHFAFKQHKARRQVLENKLEQNRLATISGAFEQWRYRIRELELAPMAEDLRQKFDDGLVYAALSTWKGTSKRLPAIGFFGRSLKKHAWQKWRAALPEARRMRRAARAGDERMMSDMLFKWKLAYRARVARRVAARSRGGAGLLRMRPSGDVLRSPSRTPSPVQSARASRRRALFRLDNGGGADA